MKKTVCKSIAIFLLFALCISYSAFPALALDTPSIADSIAVTVGSAECTVYANKDAYLSGDAMVNVNSAGDSTVKSLQISGTGDDLQLSFTLDSQPLTFNGKLYPIVGGGYYDDKLIFGEFNPNSSHTVVLFRIESEYNDSRESYLTIILQSIHSQTVYLLEFSLAEDSFSEFHNLALKNYLRQSEEGQFEIMDKTMKLMNYRNNWDNTSSAQENTYSLNSTYSLTSYTFDSTQGPGGGSTISISSLETFFEDMDVNGATGKTYSMYSSIYQMLNQDGWKVYYNSSVDAPYFYVLYGVDLGEYRAVQILYGSYDHAYYSQSSVISSCISVLDAVTVRIDGLNVKVLYYDVGPQLQNVSLAVTKMTADNSFFRSAVLMYELSASSNTLQMIFGTTNVGSTLYNIWDVLDSMTYDSIASNSLYGLGSTPEQQEMMFDGIIRTVCISSEHRYLIYPSNYMQLEVNVENYTSHSGAFQFNAFNNF